MKSNEHFWSYLAQFFLESEKIQKNVLEEIKTHFMSKNFFSENQNTFYVQ